MSISREQRDVQRAARRLGVRPTYLDMWGRRRAVEHETLRQAVEQLSDHPVPVADELPLRVAAGHRRRLGQLGPGKATVILADGTQVDLATGTGTGRVRLPPDLPIGRHQLRIQGRGRDRRRLVLVAPSRGWDRPDLPATSIFVPLHGVIGSSPTDVGTLGDLERLAIGLGTHGPMAVAVLPLLATDPAVPSPYSPLSRSYWNEVHLDLSRLPGTSAALADPDRIARIEQRRRAHHVDWVAAAAEVHAVLEQAPPALHDRVADETAGDRALDAYTSYRSGGDPAVARRHRLGQWAMRRQLAELSVRLEEAGHTLALDLPVGATADGFDVRTRPDDFLEGWSVGAPPDNFFSGGQNWAFPPPHPVTTRLNGHELFARSVATLAAHAGLVRIDHVMGLQRLWCIPPGGRPTDGVYIHYPTAELLDVLLIESHLHRSVVVGEDLGTVAPSLRRATDRAGLLGMYEEQFSIDGAHRRGLPEVPARVVAGMNTHDLPTFAGYWAGSDIADRLDLGLIDSVRADELRAERQAALAAYRQVLGDLPDEPLTVLHAAQLRLAGSSARQVSVTLEDLWLEPEPQNVPGTYRERPNWTRRLSLSIDQLLADHRVVTALSGIHAARRAGPVSRGVEDRRS